MKTVMKVGIGLVSVMLSFNDVGGSIDASKVHAIRQTPAPASIDFEHLARDAQLYNQISLESFIHPPQVIPLEEFRDFNLNVASVDEIIRYAYGKVNPPRLLQQRYFASNMFNESGFRPDAESGMGARGMTQMTGIAWQEVMPDIDFDSYGFHPVVNSVASLKYMVFLHDYIKDNYKPWPNASDRRRLDLITAGYNGGVFKLERNGWQISRMPLETRNHVKKVDNLFYFSSKESEQKIYSLLGRTLRF